MSTPREIPVTFTDACAQAILAGRKTQARRVVRDPAEACPFGEPGDRLWLRETTEMTRERARVVVEVEGVRREPLQAISDQDLAAEGDVTREPFADVAERRQIFASWWNSVHHRPGTKWADAPEVWVVRFRPVASPEGCLPSHLPAGSVGGRGAVGP